MTVRPDPNFILYPFTYPYPFPLSLETECQGVGVKIFPKEMEHNYYTITRHHTSSSYYSTHTYTGVH